MNGPESPGFGRVSRSSRWKREWSSHLEPVAYVAGWGGVRIEDDVVVMLDGPEWLTDARD